MKVSLFTLPLGLALGLAATSAFAAPDGRINFTGKINSTTCPIEIVNPEHGGVSNLVSLGWVDSSEFKGTVGNVAGERAFKMRLTPDSSCVLDPLKLNATMTFKAVYENGEHYGLKPTANPASGVAVAIKDKMGAYVKNGVASAVYKLSATDPTLMDFSAMYIATSATVTPGSADADVEFTIAIN